MFRSIKKVETQIPIELQDMLTANSCVTIVTELVKYVMLQKQQIPLSFDSLVKLAEKPPSAQRSLTSVTNIVNAVNSVSNNLSEQFQIEGCNIKEIIILIGATIVTPKLCIRIELPSDILNNSHLDEYHDKRKPLLNVMRSIFQCPEFQDEMASPLGLANTFVLIQKKDPHRISEFFIPKPQFNLPSQKTATFNIKLNHNISNAFNCRCLHLVQVYRDPMSSLIRRSRHDSDDSYEWYQSKEVFKGFKLR